MVNIPPIHIYLWWWLGDGLYGFTHTRTSRNGKVYQTWGICSPSYPPDGIKILGREAWGIMVFKTSAVHLLVVKKKEMSPVTDPPYSSRLVRFLFPLKNPLLGNVEILFVVSDVAATIVSGLLALIHIFCQCSWQMSYSHAKKDCLLLAG